MFNGEDMIRDLKSTLKNSMKRIVIVLPYKTNKSNTSVSMIGQNLNIVYAYKLPLKN